MNRFATTGTFWGNVCGSGQNVMPAPIPPEDYRDFWQLMSTNVTLVSQEARCINLYLTWTWMRVDR